MCLTKMMDDMVMIQEYVYNGSKHDMLGNRLLKRRRKKMK